MAQQSDARGFITINGGLQAASADFSDNIAFGYPLFGPEEGDFDTRYRGGGDTLLDVSGGVRIWRHLAVGAGVSQFSHEDDAGITGRIPHPFLFDRSRQISSNRHRVRRPGLRCLPRAICCAWANRADRCAAGRRSPLDHGQDHPLRQRLCRPSSPWARSNALAAAPRRPPQSPPASRWVSMAAVRPVMEPGRWCRGASWRGAG